MLLKKILQGIVVLIATLLFLAEAGLSDAPSVDFFLLSPATKITKSTRLRLSSNDPARFFIEALGLNPDNISPILQKYGYGIIPLPPSTTLDRLATFSSLYVREVTPPPWWSRKRPDGWLLTYRTKPIGVLLRVWEYGLIFQDFQDSMGSGISIGSLGKSVKEHSEWLIFKKILFRRFLEGLQWDYGFEYRDVKIFDPPLDQFIIRWEDVSVDGFGTHSIPVFIDVYTPSNIYVKGLLEYIFPKIERGEKILILGTGAGPEAIFIGKNRDVLIHAVDIGELEVANTKASVAFHGLQGRIRVWQSDGFKNVSERYDRILFDAPRPDLERSQGDDIRRWDPEGRLIQTILLEFPNHLKPGGVFYLMSFPKELDAILKEMGQPLLIESYDPGYKDSFRIFEIYPPELNPASMDSAL